MNELVKVLGAIAFGVGVGAVNMQREIALGQSADAWAAGDEAEALRHANCAAEADAVLRPFAGHAGIQLD